LRELDKTLYQRVYRAREETTCPKELFAKDIFASIWSSLGDVLRICQRWILISVSTFSEIVNIHLTLFINPFSAAWRIFAVMFSSKRSDKNDDIDVMLDTVETLPFFKVDASAPLVWPLTPLEIAIFLRLIKLYSLTASLGL
jgi:hypothetical protein